MAGALTSFEETVYGLAPASQVATATGAALAVTLNARAGIITTEALTTAADATAAYVVTNNLIRSTSNVLAWVAGGTNTEAVIVKSIVAANGSVTITLWNRESADALDGTVIFGFLVLN